MYPPCLKWFRTLFCRLTYAARGLPILPIDVIHTSNCSGESFQGMLLRPGGAFAIAALQTAAWKAFLRAREHLHLSWQCWGLLLKFLLLTMHLQMQSLSTTTELSMLAPLATGRILDEQALGWEEGERANATRQVASRRCGHDYNNVRMQMSCAESPDVLRAPHHFHRHPHGTMWKRRDPAGGHLKDTEQACIAKAQYTLQRESILSWDSLRCTIVWAG